MMMVARKMTVKARCRKSLAFSHNSKNWRTDKKYQEKAHKQTDILFIPLIRQNMQDCRSKHMKKSQIFHPLIDFLPHDQIPPAINIRNVNIHKTSAVNRIRIRRAHPSPMVLNTSTSRLSDTGCATAARNLYTRASSP